MTSDNQELYDLMAEARIAAAQLQVISKPDTFTLFGLTTQASFFIGLGIFCVIYIYSSSGEFLSRLNEQNSIISVVVTLLFLGIIISLLGTWYSISQFLNYRNRQQVARNLLEEYESVMDEVEDKI